MSSLRRSPALRIGSPGQRLVLRCCKFCAHFSIAPSAYLSCPEALSCPLGSYVKCSASLSVCLACFFSLPVPLGFQFQTWYPSGVTLSSGAKRNAFQIEHKCASRAELSSFCLRTTESRMWPLHYPSLLTFSGA